MNWDKAFAERAEYLPTFTIGKFLKIAVEDKSVISLGPGEPDFMTPAPILNYAKKMIDKNTHYSPVAGRSETKKAFANYLKKNNKIKVDPEKEVMITAGSQEGLMLGLMCVVDPGEEVLIPDPGFLAYTPGCYTLNATPVSIWMKTFYNQQDPKLDAQNATMFSLPTHRLPKKMLSSPLKRFRKSKPNKRI